MFFELEDIQRRHSHYWDLYNVGGWVRPADNSASWNYQRGLLAGVTANILQENLINFQENWRLLETKYEKPANWTQAGIFIKTILKSENYTRAIKNRNQYALTLGVFDWAPRVAIFRWLNGGWQKPFGGFEFNMYRKIPTSILAAAITAPLAVPFEMAKNAYYGDKTFPVEHQRRYTSYWNALRRIPFEEGPYYLFKNSFPIYIRNFLVTLTAFYSFDFLKDKMSWMWRVGQVPYEPIKAFMAGFSTYLACVFSYPWAVVTRQMIELWPKEANGKCTWDNNYRKAAVWLWYQETSNVYFPGLFNNYFWRQAPLIFTTLYLSDLLGIFNYNQIDLMSGQGTNTWEDSFA